MPTYQRGARVRQRQRPVLVARTLGMRTAARGLQIPARLILRLERLCDSAWVGIASGASVRTGAKVTGATLGKKTASARPASTAAQGRAFNTSARTGRNMTIALKTATV